MKTVHPNIEVLQRLDPLNLAETSDVLADDVVFHYFNPMLPDFQGDYVGREGFQAFFKKMAQHTKGTFKVNPIRAIPAGDELVVVHSKNTLSLEDQPLEFDVVVVWRILDGEIKEAWDIPGVYTVKHIQD